jgi:hypothetical protein
VLDHLRRSRVRNGGPRRPLLRSAIEAPAPAINAANLRCDYDEEGNCVKVDLCNDAGGTDGDCLAEHEPRAWSSPIFVDFSAEEDGTVSRHTQPQRAYDATTPTRCRSTSLR